MNISENYITTVLATAVGLLGYFVGRHQAKTERLRFRHELYDRRMKVFRATMELLAQIVREANIDLPRLFEFNVATKESYFLLGNEIHDYLWKLHCKAVDLRSLNTKLHESNLPIGKERTEAANAETELLKWFGDQSDVALKKFAKHMSLRE